MRDVRGLRRRDRIAHMREFLFVFAPSVAVVAAAMWLAYQFVPPPPPLTVRMSTGAETGAYHHFGRRYAEILARSGIKLELVTSRGSRENVARLSDPKSGFQVALLQGGVTETNAAPGIVSLGRLYYEPLWIFTRSGAPISRLGDLRGKRVAIGPEGSGTRALTLKLLSFAKVTGDSAELSGPDFESAADQLMRGEIDAAIMVMGWDSKTVQRLLAAPGISLMSETQADALMRREGALGKVILPAGVIDLSAGTPERDVVMVAPQAALIARENLHPAIISLLVAAAKEVHAPAGLFQRQGEFPIAADPELPMSSEALYSYQYGATLLQRHLPFWIANFIERSIVLLIPIATILLPMFKIAPSLYRWRVRRRIWRWYRSLKHIEARLSSADAPTRDVLTGEIERIAQAASAIPMPARYAGELYHLREHIELVRQRIAAKAPNGPGIPVYEARTSH